MQGEYLTPKGDTKKVLMYDDINKMVYVNVYASRYTWVHENEYSKWVKKGEPVIKIAKPAAHIVEEVPVADKIVAIESPPVVSEKEISKPVKPEAKKKTIPKKKEK